MSDFPAYLKARFARPRSRSSGDLQETLYKWHNEVNIKFNKMQHSIDCLANSESACILLI